MLKSLLILLAIASFSAADTLDFEPPEYQAGNRLDGQDHWRFNPIWKFGHADDFRVQMNYGHGDSRFLRAHTQRHTEYSRVLSPQSGSAELTWRWRAPEGRARLCLGPSDSLLPGQPNWDAFRVKVCFDEVDLDSREHHSHSGCHRSHGRHPDQRKKDWLYMRLELDLAAGVYSLYRDEDGEREDEDTLVRNGSLRGAGPVSRLFLKAGDRAPFVDVDDIRWKGAGAPLPLVLAITSPSRDTLVNRTPITVAYTVNGTTLSRSVALGVGLNAVVMDTVDSFGHRAADTVNIEYVAILDADAVISEIRLDDRLEHQCAPVAVSDDSVRTRIAPAVIPEYALSVPVPVSPCGNGNLTVKVDSCDCNGNADNEILYVFASGTLIGFVDDKYVLETTLDAALLAGHAGDSLRLTIRPGTGVASVHKTAVRLGFDAPACPSTSSISVQIANLGTDGIPAGLSAALYEGNPADSGRLLATAVVSQAIDAGADAAVQFNVPERLEGPRKIFAVADDDGNGTGVYPEADEANNTDSTMLAFCSMHPPAILSPPTTQSLLCAPYAHDLDAVDPEGEALRYSLPVRPRTMSLDSLSGLIEWDPCFVDSLEGPIASFPFSGDAGDFSGRENHLDVSGPVLTTGRNGAVARAYHFDGVDDRMRSVTLSPTISADLTVSPGCAAPRPIPTRRALWIWMVFRFA